MLRGLPPSAYLAELLEQPASVPARYRPRTTSVRGVVACAPPERAGDDPEDQNGARIVVRLGSRGSASPSIVAAALAVVVVASACAPTKPPPPPPCPGCTVYLTFDDGPGVYTPQILSVLAAKGAPATFFVVGQHAAQFPSLVQQEHANGHGIGDHGWSHAALTELPPASIHQELESTAVEIAARPARVPRCGVRRSALSTTP